MNLGLGPQWSCSWLAALAEQSNPTFQVLDVVLPSGLLAVHRFDQLGSELGWKARSQVAFPYFVMWRVLRTRCGTVLSLYFEKVSTNLLWCSQKLILQLCMYHLAH